MEKSKEQIRYYYIEKKLPNVKENILNGIFTDNEIKQILRDEHYNDLCSIENLQELIYNINNNSININIEIEQEKDVEKLKEISMNTKQILENSINNQNFFINIKNNVLNDILDHYDDITMNYDDDTDFMVNLLSNSVYNCDIRSQSLPRYSGSNILFAYIERKNKMLMFRSEDLGFFVNKFPIFDYKLLIINETSTIKNIDKDKIKTLKHNFLFRIINKNEIINEEDIKTYIDNCGIQYYKLYIILNILHKLSIHNNQQQNMYNKLLDLFYGELNYNSYVNPFITIDCDNNIPIDPFDITLKYLNLIEYFKKKYILCHDKKIIAETFYNNDKKYIDSNINEVFENNLSANFNKIIKYKPFIFINNYTEFIAVLFDNQINPKYASSRIYKDKNTQIALIYLYYIDAIPLQINTIINIISYLIKNSVKKKPNTDGKTEQQANTDGKTEQQANIDGKTEQQANTQIEKLENLKKRFALQKIQKKEISTTRDESLDDQEKKDEARLSDLKKKQQELRKKENITVGGYYYKYLKYKKKYQQLKEQQLKDQ